ncbi:MAG TPA: TSUP family transporter [Frankiaceae bacterium]|nr:TSUP family transporter [Frankiaceae bacterium]
MPLVLAVVVVGLSAAVQGAIGFGLNLLAVPVLLLVDPSLIPGPMLVAGLTLSLLVVGREVKAMDRRLGWALLGLLPGTVLGLLLLVSVSTNALNVLLGLLVLGAVGVSALSWSPARSRTALVAAGAASGFLGTAAAIGGPPLALLYADTPGPRLRSTLSGFFVAAALVSLGALVLAGRFGLSDLRASLALLPGAVIGFLLSGPLRPLVDRGHARTAVLALSAVAAIAAIAEGLLR